jgi:hypothetical protein
MVFRGTRFGGEPADFPMINFVAESGLAATDWPMIPLIENPRLIRFYPAFWAVCRTANRVGT